MEALKRFFLLSVSVFALSTLASPKVAYAEGAETVPERVFSTSPRKNNGRAWRIGYYEGGFHGNYERYLRATVAGLMKLGWIKDADLPELKGRDTFPIWQWLAQNIKSEYVEFVEDAYYTANWDDAERQAKRSALVGRLKKDRDIDLIIAMGTWAGKDLASNDHSTPTIVMSSSDPVGSGIIASAGDSGFDHLHARVDPKRYERQVRVFHDVINFKRLGVAYEDSVVGKSYAAIDVVERVAAERGFEVVHCHTQSDIADQQLAGQSVVKCFEQLSRTVDAIYVTVQGGVNAETIPKLVKLANNHRIPTFSQLGSSEVKHGFLLSISRAGGFKPVGRFLAATVAKVFNHARPRELNQVFEDAPNIAINLKTAELVGLYLYAHVLAAADEIYRDISVPR
ncbi:MAG: ABC transporter substrate binding protein [Pseudomonadota bacterium]